MSVTIADVAARAGVSKATVSRILNGRGEHNVETARRVRAIVAELGYVPSARAVGLARGSTRTIGMLVPALTWPWMGEVLQGVADALEQRAYGLLLYTCNRGDDSLRIFSSHLSANAFDGLLVIEPEGTLSYIEELYSRGLPVVLIDDRGHRPQFPSVATTNRAGGEAAAAHLLELGRTRPAVLTGITQFGCTRDRLSGFADAYADAGHPLHGELVVEGDFTIECGRRAVRQLLDEGHQFDAVFAHNDLSAVGVMQALRERGKRVPDDVAVVGFDDIPLAADADPSLTTVHQPMREMGETAARLLLSMLQGGPPPVTPVIRPTTLVVRDSTGERHATPQ